MLGVPVNFLTLKPPGKGWKNDLSASSLNSRVYRARDSSIRLACSFLVLLECIFCFSYGVRFSGASLLSGGWGQLPPILPQLPPASSGICGNGSERERPQELDFPGAFGTSWPVWDFDMAPPAGIEPTSSA